MVFCVVVIAVLIGINLLINTSKDTDTAPKDEITSVAVTTTHHINADASEENVLYTNPTTEPNTTASNTVSLQNATKSTEKTASSDKSSKSTEKKRESNSSSSESNSGDVNSQSHYSDSSSSNANSYNTQPKIPQSGNYSSKRNSSANSKSSSSSSKASSKTSSTTNSSSSAVQSSAAPKPTEPAPKPTQSQNNIYLSYSYITVSQGDVVFLSLIGAQSGVSWSVSNSSVLINYGGGGNQCSFKAVSKGTAVVTANYNGASYYCTVKVS